MKLEIRTISVTIEPGLVVEGDTKEKIKDALLRMFNYRTLSSLHLWVDGIGYEKAAEDVPSIRAEDIEDEGDDGFEIIDRVIDEGEKYAEFKSKQHNLFAEEEAA